MSGALVTVAAFDNAFEAGYWRGLVEAQGIPAVLADQELVTTDWLYSRAVGDIKLQVSEEDAPRVRAMLDELRVARPYRPPEESAARRAVRVALLGFFLLPLQLYSLWILARLFPRRRELTPLDRRRMALAALLDLYLPLVAVAYWLILSQ